MGIAPAAPSALGEDEVFAGGHVYDDLICFGVPDDGTPGNLDDQVFPPFARHFPTLTADTGGGLVLAPVAEIQKGGQVVVDPENDAAAMPAVTAVRAAGGHIFFPVERHRSIAAPSADDGDAHFIHEHNCIVLLIYGSTGTSFIQPILLASSKASRAIFSLSDNREWPDRLLGSHWG